MKLIIAGGRNYRLNAHDQAKLDCLLSEVTEVVSGGATGAGAAGEEWAGRHGLPVRRFPADWARHGKKAGPIRNRIMAEYAGAVVPFPGGRGTENMHNEAVRCGLRVFDWRNGQRNEVRNHG